MCRRVGTVSIIWERHCSRLSLIFSTIQVAIHTSTYIVKSTIKFWHPNCRVPVEDTSDTLSFPMDSEDRIVPVDQCTVRYPTPLDPYICYIVVARRLHTIAVRTSFYNWHLLINHNDAILQVRHKAINEPCISQSRWSLNILTGRSIRGSISFTVSFHLF